MRPLIEIIENFYYIKTKEGKLQLLKLNDSQRQFYELIKPDLNDNKPVKVIVLKSRQMGISTLTEALIFGFTSLQFNIKSLIVAHNTSSTNAIYSMAKLFYDNLPLELKPMIKNSNAKMLNFENPTSDPEEKLKYPGLRSQIRVETSGTGGIGRGETFNYVHLSEFAFWGKGKKDALDGLQQSIPQFGRSLLVIESTANGYEFFKKLWDDAVEGRSDMIPVFLSWKEFEEYRMPYTGFELNEKEKELINEYDLSLEQITWRRWCIRNNCSNDEQKFMQEYPLIPEEAFMLSGNPVFNQQIVLSRIKYLDNNPPTQAVGRFVDGKFKECEDGEITIYENPKKDIPYVLGGDTAGDGSDYFEAYVLDNTTGIQVAKYTCQTDEGLFVRQMYDLGMYYNTALESIEVNYSTYPVKRLEEIGYQNQYVRKQEDTYADNYQKKFGFNTNSLTRPIIIANLVEIVRESIYLIKDVTLLKQMLSFVKNDQGRPEAAAGEHDDKVMACAIAYYCRDQQSMIKKIEKAKEESNDVDSFLNYGGS